MNLPHAENKSWEYLIWECLYPNSATSRQIRPQTRTLGLYKQSPQRRAEILKVRTLKGVGVK